MNRTKTFTRNEDEEPMTVPYWQHTQNGSKCVLALASAIATAKTNCENAVAVTFQ